MRGGRLLTPLNYIAQSTDLDAQTCLNGQYVHNNDNSSSRMLTICQSGKSRAKF